MKAKPERRRTLQPENAAGPVYLDCNATTPLEERVRDVMMRSFAEEIGNPGSRTHAFGTRARKAIEEARAHVARVVDARPEEVYFTSGATEANNLAILGLAAFGKKVSRKHIVSTAIEHKAVLEPLDALRAQGFEVDLVPPARSGAVDAQEVCKRVRFDTLLVSVMHVNNETGILQPLPPICSGLAKHEAFLHVDAAQGFGKELGALRHARVDLISVSAHKIFGPKGVGALIARRRGFDRAPLTPLMFGGGQERGLRPGTLPTPLIEGLGEASRLALVDNHERQRRCLDIRREALAALETVGLRHHGEPQLQLPHVLNISFPGVDSEALMVALKAYAAISNGSACTSHSYETSHVLRAMSLDFEHIAGAVRFSWSHLTPMPDWTAIAKAIAALRK